MIGIINAPASPTVAHRMLLMLGRERALAHDRLVAIDPETTDPKDVVFALHRYRTLDAAYREAVEIWQNAVGTPPPKEPGW